MSVTIHVHRALLALLWVAPAYAHAQTQVIGLPSSAAGAKTINGVAPDSSGNLTITPGNLSYTNPSAPSVVRTMQDALSDTLNVKSAASVKCDGLTDDAAALQEAFRIAVLTGKTLSFPAGANCLSASTSTANLGGWYGILVTGTGNSVLSVQGNGATIIDTVTPADSHNYQTTMILKGQFRSVSFDGLSFTSTHAIGKYGENGLAIGANPGDTVGNLSITNGTFTNHTNSIAVLGAGQSFIGHNHFFLTNRDYGPGVDPSFPAGTSGIPNQAIRTVITSNTEVAFNTYNGCTGTATLTAAAALAASTLKQCGDGLLIGTSKGWKVHDNIIQNFNFEGIFLVGRHSESPSTYLTQYPTSIYSNMVDAGLIAGQRPNSYSIRCDEPKCDVYNNQWNNALQGLLVQPDVTPGDLLPGIHVHGNHISMMTSVPYDPQGGAGSEYGMLIQNEQSPIIENNDVTWPSNHANGNTGTIQGIFLTGDVYDPTLRSNTVDGGSNIASGNALLQGYSLAHLGVAHMDASNVAKNLEVPIVTYGNPKINATGFISINNTVSPTCGLNCTLGPIDTGQPVAASIANYTGLVATRTLTPDIFYPGNTVAMSRTMHWMRDTSTISLVFQNFYVASLGYGAATYQELSPGTATIRASVEYPVELFNGTVASGSNSVTVDNAAGITVGQQLYGQLASYFQPGTTVSGISGTTITASSNATASASAQPMAAGNITQCSFGGSTTATVAGLTDAITDPCVAIPTNSMFFTREFYSNPNGLIFETHMPAGALSWIDQLWYGAGTPDYTAGGTVVPTNGTIAAMYPQAIIGATARPSFCNAGDSRSEGVNDVANDVTGDTGELARLIQPVFAMTKTAVYGDDLPLALPNYVNRKRLFVYCTDVIDEYGINDKLGGQSDAQIAANRTAFAKTIAAGKRVWGTTLPNETTSSDGWATIANQTISDDARGFNALVRAGIVGESGYFDVANAVDPLGLGKWPVSAVPGSSTGNANFATTDGVHESNAMNSYIAQVLGYVTARIR